MAIKYNDICSKADKAFHARAKQILGSRYYELVPIAKKAFDDAYRESNEIQRENKAIAAANRVFSKEM